MSGWILEHAYRLGVGPVDYPARVMEEPGLHVWVTMADKKWQPVRTSSGHILRVATPGHHKRMVYSTRREAIAAQSKEQAA